MKIYEIEKILRSVNRQAPLSADMWQLEAASKHRLLPILGNCGRPRKDIL